MEKTCFMLFSESSCEKTWTTKCDCSLLIVTNNISGIRCPHCKRAPEFSAVTDPSMALVLTPKLIESWGPVVEYLFAIAVAPLVREIGQSKGGA